MINSLKPSEYKNTAGQLFIVRYQKSAEFCKCEARRFIIRSDLIHKRLSGQDKLDDGVAERGKGGRVAAV